MKHAGIGLRLAAQIIDAAVFFTAGYALALVTGDLTPDGYHLRGAPAFLLFAAGFTYFSLMEARPAGTLGKQAAGIAVRTPDGRPCGLRASLLRNVLRIVDWLPFFYALGLILIATSPARQRLGDRVAGTVVVQNARR